MHRTNFAEMACSIARTLDVIGEPWSLLILRDVWVGFVRFEQIRADLDISRKVLTERLNHLVEQGVLERRPYDRRPRYEYVLSEKGAELIDLLMVMVAWGDKWLAGDAGPPVLYRHRACGEISRVDLRCAHCGEVMHAGDVELLAGPGARLTHSRRSPAGRELDRRLDADPAPRGRNQRRTDDPADNGRGDDEGGGAVQ
jgi:DNA-binding HxlR family transcriptional regulator